MIPVSQQDSATLPSNPLPNQLSAQHLREITQNTWQRYTPSSSKTAYLFLNTKLTFEATSPNNDPRFRPLHNVTLENNDTIRAQSPGLTDYYGSKDRGLSMQLKANGQKISGYGYCLSPTNRPAATSFSIFKDSSNDSIHTNTTTQTLAVNAHDILKRKAKRRQPSQNTVMQCSAKSELIKFYRRNKKYLSTDAKNFIQNNLDNQEWLHQSAYSLTPLTDNPQQASNLGAASKDENTRMMVIESFAHFFSQFDDVDVKINPRFKLFNNSNVIKSIHYTLTLCHEGKTLTVTQHTECFSHHSPSHASDKLLITIAHKLLKATPTDMTDYKKNHPHNPNSLFQPIKETNALDRSTRQNIP